MDTLHYFKKCSVLSYAVLWLLLSIVFFGLSYFIYSFIQMSHGDVNRDGVVDGRDSSIVAKYVSLSDGGSSTTYTVVSNPPTNTARPHRYIQKPIVYEQ